MIKVEQIEVMNWKNAIRGMRNPLNSWERSDSSECVSAGGYEMCNDSVYGHCPRQDHFSETVFCLGAEDLKLMQRLYKGGTEHRKFMRQILVSMDLTCPLYWWKEFDTYKVGTVANSCSTMHKIHSKEFTLDDFSTEHLTDSSRAVLERTIAELNLNRNRYLTATKTEEYTGLPAKAIWWQMIQLLPSSYNQKRTVTMNYEVAATIIRQRSTHKLDEWVQFVEILKQLPYLADIIN